MSPRAARTPASSTDSDAHLRDTQRWVTETAAVLGLDQELVTTMGLAGLLHDVGKADHRFQVLLREGRIPDADEELLAKSAIPPLDRRRNRLAVEQSGYPPGLRHEVASVALASSYIAGSGHPELLRFLIAAHHGYARPFFPPQVDPDQASVHYHGELDDMAADSPIDSGRWERSPLATSKPRWSGTAGSEPPGSNQSFDSPIMEPAVKSPLCKAKLDMSELKLTGLTANSAHGYLAALGVVEALRSVGIDTGMFWSTDFYPHAILRGVSDSEILISALLEDRDRRMRGAVLNHPPGHPFDTLGCSKDELSAWAERIGELPDDDPDVDQWAALLIEGGFTAQSKAKPTQFRLQRRTSQVPQGGPADRPSPRRNTARRGPVRPVALPQLAINTAFRPRR